VIEPNGRDELTGVLARHAGLSAVGREVERCRRSDTKLVLGVVQVVALPAVNDSVGRDAGDEILRSVAAALTAMLRSRDVIVRSAGDKFVFSMAGVTLQVAEKRFQHVSLLLGDKAPESSVTIGFTDLRSGDTVDDMVARAEAAAVVPKGDRRRA
jgi:diguanylate cyclase (GGDEF)-like protein